MLQKSYFSDFECTIGYLGVFLTNIDFTAKHSFSQRIFLTPIISVKNTPNRFFACFLNFFHFHPNIFIVIDFWGVKAALFKIL